MRKTFFFSYAKTKTQIVVHAKLIRGNREADQRLCFHYTESTIPLLPKSEISSLQPSSVAVQPGLCRTWSETPKTGFLKTRLRFKYFFFFSIWETATSPAIAATSASTVMRMTYQCCFTQGSCCEGSIVNKYNVQLWSMCSLEVCTHHPKISM